MPSARIHKEQAFHNYSFLRSISNDFRDWKLIVAFYTALQLIDSELTTKNVRWREGSQGNMYEWRDRIISNYFREIYTSYGVLLQRSKEARYLEGVGERKATDYLTVQIVDDCLEKHFKKITDFFNFNPQ